MSAEDNLTVSVTFRVSPKQKAILDEAADAAEVSLGDFIRGVLFADDLGPEAKKKKESAVPDPECRVPVAKGETGAIVDRWQCPGCGDRVFAKPVCPKCKTKRPTK